MALQFDGVTVGAMQYNGVTIGEAMIDGQIVYRADTGPDPASGSWGPTSVTAGPQTMATYTITHDAEYTIEYIVPDGIVLTVISIRRNGVEVAAANGQPAVATYTGPLQAGDVIEFTAHQPIGTLTLTGTWTITPKQIEPRTWRFILAGNYTITLPEWTSYVDIVCIGGGGAGGNGGGAAARAGEGGKAGTFGTASFEVQDLSSMRLTAEVGGGGTRGSGAGATGGGGSSSRVVYYGTTNRVGNPGQGGAGGRGALGNASLTAGRSAESITYNGTHYSGGSGGAYVDRGGGRVGNTPGGGGGGGGGGVLGAYWEGGNGGRGAVWITAYP